MDVLYVDIRARARAHACACACLVQITVNCFYRLKKSYCFIKEATELCEMHTDSSKILNRSLVDA